MLDLHSATREVARLLDGITDEHLSAPSPSDCDVATLLDHLIGLTMSFTKAAEKSFPPGGSRRCSPITNTRRSARRAMPRSPAIAIPTILISASAARSAPTFPSRRNIAACS